MEAPSPVQFGLTQEQIHRIEDRLWRLRLLAATAVGLVGGMAGLWWLRDFLFTRGSRDITFDTLMIALPIAIFFGVACGMGCFIFLLNPPFSLGDGHARIKRYQAAVAGFKKQLRQSQQEHWSRMSGKQLRQAVEGMYRRLGYELLPAPREAAEWVDLSIKKDDTTVLVQCRPQGGPVDWQVARALAEVQKQLKVYRVVVISIPGFTPKAKRFAEGKPLGLLSVPELANMQLYLEAQEGAKARATAPSQ